MNCCRRLLLWAGLLGLPLFGFGQTATIFKLGAQWSFFKGKSDPSPSDATAWQKINYDDFAWSKGPAPVFYGEPVTGTELTDMRGAYPTVFLRRQFVLTNANEIGRLTLGVLANDGFVAWINGREVARENAPVGALDHNSTALAPLMTPLVLEPFEIPNTDTLLVSGTNVVAVLALNASLANSSDFLFDASLDSVADIAPPLVQETVPAPGSTVGVLASVEVQFNEPVNGVEATDLLINGVPATGVSEVAPADFVFTFPQPSAGNVTVEWQPNHGIVDRSPLKHPFAGGSWTYKLDLSVPPSSVFISEFLASNNKSLHDEDGDNSDWIEIANTGTNTVSLNGWFLTDDATDLAKWKFPDVSISANGFLVVFASGKDRTNLTGRLHTNFKLSDTGEYLALADAGHRVVSDFSPAYPKQQVDVSYGRANGAPQLTGFFTQPTPGAPNAASGPGFAPEVSFSRAGGTFTGAFAFSLKAALTNAEIHYTLDGTLPTQSSLLYARPFSITASTQVRARAFAPGLLPGPPRSEAYVLLNANVTNFVSDLPVMILHTLGSSQPNGSSPIFAQYMVFEPVNGRSSLTNAPTLSVRGAAKLRGSSTEGLPKASYAVEFRDDFNFDQDHEILGMPAESDWVLYAPNDFEPILIHNPFMYQLSRNTGIYSPRTRFVELYINRGSGPISSSSYNGIYVLEEKIKIGKDRVNIDRLEPENATVPSVTGGYLMKVDRLDPGDSGFSGGGQIIAYVDPKERDLKTTQRLPQRNYLTQYFNSMSKALSAANWRDPVLGYAAYLDAQNWVDFNILEVLSLNVDAMRLSTYFYKPRNGKITYGPHWDFDRALGSTDGRDNNPRQWATSSQFTEVWWSRLFGDLDFWQRWVDRYQTWRQRELSTATLYGMIDDLTGQLRNAQPREQAKWHHPLRGGSYQSEINYSKAWLSNHCAFLDQQFVQMPKPNSAGGQVANRFNFTLTGPAAPAVVLYTLDGRDPRLAGGTISKLAVTNRNAIVISSNMIVTARAYNPANRQTAGGPAVNSIWSAPVTTVFTVEPPPLALTEIMFHPADPPVGSPFGKEDFEFLELKNISGHALDLPGYHFTNGIQFRFAATNSVTRLAPGERLLLVHNRLAFATRYAGVANIAGEYAGALSNGGNRLTLAGPLGEPVFDVEYGDQWEPLADGFGFSLVLADEAVPPNQWNQAASWRLSGAVGGSPGGVDRQASPVPRVLVNEALAHPSPTAGRADAIELYNDSPDTADISGWFLTDDFRAPRKFRIPDGTTIPARGYQVFTELQFATGGVTGFALDAQGDQAWLFAAEPGGNLRPWVHGFEFGASPAGESFGRWVTTTGEEHFVAQSQLTLGLSNAGPRLGPVILSEVMYNPPLDGVANNTLDEYVELRNVSTNNVSLFDPDHATNTWRLRGGIDFDFPSGTVLAPGSTLAVVSFDPAVNLGALANFRAHYHLTPGGTILGPWSGHLDNQSDGIQLLRPDVPVISSGSGAVKVPYVLVEEVNYTNEEPWPVTVSGTGLSLHRRDPLQYANDPASWSEGTPDPAAADSDNDGLPDAWEIANGLDPFSATGADGADGDPDHDGATNWEEFRAGTLPRDAGSYYGLRIGWNPQGGTIITANGLPNTTYTLQYCDQLGQPWKFLTPMATDNAGHAVFYVFLLASDQRYFRLSSP